MSHPRLFIGHLTKVRLEVGDVECVAHHVLGCWNVDDVGVIVDALEDIEGSMSARLQLGVLFFRESFLV